VKPGGVPAGNYRARFVGLEDTTHIEYGAGLRFKFRPPDMGPGIP